MGDQPEVSASVGRNHGRILAEDVPLVLAAEGRVGGDGDALRRAEREELGVVVVGMNFHLAAADTAEYDLFKGENSTVEGGKTQPDA